MEVPLEVTYHDVQKTEDIQQLIEQRAEALELVCGHVISCRVAVERPHGAVRKGNPFEVRLLARVPPGHELVVHEPAQGGSPDDSLAMLLHSAFDALERQAEAVKDKQRDDRKQHPHQEVQALVLRLFPQEDYGFLKTLDGREVYFHRNSVLHNDFDRIEIGTGVRFEETMGDKGPQATTVAIVDKPGARAGKGGETPIEPPLGWNN